MSIFNKIFSGGIGEVIEKTGNAIDKLTTTKEEKLQLKNDFNAIVRDFELKNEEQLTERLKIDMGSDNKLSKNIRPLTLIVVTVVFLFVSIADGIFSKFEMQQSYLSIYQALMLTMYGFYFGGRTIEKFKKK